MKGHIVLSLFLTAVGVFAIKKVGLKITIKIRLHDIKKHQRSKPL